MSKCVICGKDFDYEFKFNLSQFHICEEEKQEYEHLKYEMQLCSKHCISNFVERKTREASHQNDTFVVDYKFPVGFCDKCGHGTHPTEFCQQINDYDPDTLDFHDRHMAGQGAMVKLTGGLADIYLGKGWLLGVRGVRYSAKCVQLVKDLKERAPLAVVWNNQEELDRLLPTIALDGSEHLEIKDIFTDISLIPANRPSNIQGEYRERHFYVFQVINQVSCTRKLFFPFQLAMDNCWFPVEPTQIVRFRRLFYGNLKSIVETFEKHEWTVEESEQYKCIDEEDEDCYDHFVSGMKILENKSNVMEELNVNLKDLEAKMGQHMFVGESPEVKQLDKGDNVLTQDDKEFLLEKGFDAQVLDELFIEQMKTMGVEGELDEIQEEVKIVEKMMEEKKEEEDDVGEGKKYSKRIVLDPYCFTCEGKHHAEDCPILLQGDNECKEDNKDTVLENIREECAECGC